MSYSLRVWVPVTHGRGCVGRWSIGLTHEEDEQAETLDSGRWGRGRGSIDCPWSGGDHVRGCIGGSDSERHDDYRYGTAGRTGQACLADHSGEQVLRRHVHRPQPKLVLMEDVAHSGRVAEELLRHGTLQPGQLRVDGLWSGPAGGHTV